MGSTFIRGLPFSEAEKGIVHKMIIDIAEHNIFELAFHRSEFIKRGEKIRHVHPLRFFGYIFADPQLKKNMTKISESFFKWNGFIDGFSEKIEDEANKNNLMKYLPGFAHHLGIDQDLLAPFIVKREWNKLILFLINFQK